MSSCRIDVSLQRIAANLNGLCSCTRINKGCIALVFVILVFSESWTNSNQGQDLEFGVSKTCKAVSKLKCTIQLWLRPSVFYGLARLQNVLTVLMAPGRMRCCMFSICPLCIRFHILQGSCSYTEHADSEPVPKRRNCRSAENINQKYLNTARLLFLYLLSVLMGLFHEF